ncbi:protein of unknown function [Lachnospiraceae bacterium]|nr:protein of unknown function [Lachnospiraceae bacterium]
MNRKAFALKIKEGRFEEFRSELGRVWSDAVKLLDSIGAKNMSLWNIEDLVFGYYETDDIVIPDDGQKIALAVIEEKMKDKAKWISEPWKPMRLMYQDYGIVRENKELIRHRVFATKLKGPMEEEYRRRHAELEEARGDKPDPGPDSNFTIWSAGGYIFGYDEIDVTMEKAETEESREATIKWEKKMLEIMTWYTDDIDWITGEKHKHIARIAYHN